MHFSILPELGEHLPFINQFTINHQFKNYRLNYSLSGDVPLVMARR